MLYDYSIENYYINHSFINQIENQKKKFERNKKFLLTITILYRCLSYLNITNIKKKNRIKIKKKRDNNTIIF